jgi:hypothetical protein
VTIISEFPSADAVHGMLQSEQLKTVMKEGGVIGQPDVKILNKA